jgi:DNA repair protein RadC
VSQRFRARVPVLGSPERTRQYLRHRIGMLPYEVFGLLLLDTRYRLIGAEILFRGTIAGALVRPRKVARVALQSNAAAVILFHNHPGCLSRAPRTSSSRAASKEILSLLDVRVLDHLIIADAQEYSMAESGLL